MTDILVDQPVSSSVFPRLSAFGCWRLGARGGSVLFCANDMRTHTIARMPIASLAIAAASLTIPAIALAQADFQGAWASIYHEDLPERIPGPELGDYMGFPINDAG